MLPSWIGMLSYSRGLVECAKFLVFVRLRMLPSPKGKNEDTCFLLR